MHRLFQSPKSPNLSHHGYSYLRQLVGTGGKRRPGPIPRPRETGSLEATSVTAKRRSRERWRNGNLDQADRRGPTGTDGVVKRGPNPRLSTSGAGVVELAGISPIQGPGFCRKRNRPRRSSGYTNGVNDFLRLPARDTVTETAWDRPISDFQPRREIARPRREGKSRREAR